MNNETSENAFRDKLVALAQSELPAHITREQVEKTIEGLDLKEYVNAKPTPRLLINRLRFKGIKHPDAEEFKLISYDQVFRPGVNVILIPDNSVGKSSILKTIKFALTGDDSHYDVDVRPWIASIWLTFQLDETPYTSLLTTRGGELHALLTHGHEERPLEEIAKSSDPIFDVIGRDDVKAAFQEFFFQQLGIDKLYWQQQSTGDKQKTERLASWLTYFQALVIPDNGFEYLLCDRRHAMGNQDGLLVSSFLGLKWTEALNALHLRIGHTEQEAGEFQASARRITEEIEPLQRELEEAQREVEAIRKSQQERQHAVEVNAPGLLIQEIQEKLIANGQERYELEQARMTLNDQIIGGRSQIQRLHEALAFKLHFTSLNVTMCPGCSTKIEDTAVNRERAQHVCRVCNKPAKAASTEEVVAREAQAKSLEEQTRKDEDKRNNINKRLDALRSENQRLEQEIQRLQAAMREGIRYVLPTAAEEERSRTLHESIGRLRAQIEAKRAEGGSSETNDIPPDVRVRILKKTRKILERQAASGNQAILTHLSTLIEEVVHRIGVESINHVMVTPLGSVRLHKYESEVSFTGIQNIGERLKVKLAFFLAMMRLGRQPGMGRHPGFLLIDQPGSAEMAEKYVAALAGVFRQIDKEYVGETQVLFFTARPEFRTATADQKIYGPQAGRYAF